MNNRNIIENTKVKFCLFFVVLTVLTVFMMVLYFPSGELRFGHDVYFHLYRLQALMDALKSGSYPVYIDSEAINGYGYATKWFYCDYILLPFALIGNITSLTFAYKSLLFVMSLLCGSFTYMAIKSIFRSSFVAVVTALLYTFCTYRLIDIFPRAAIGEVLAFTFVPLVLWGFYEVVSGNYKKWYILAAGYILLIFSHLLSSVLALIILIILLLVYIKPLMKESKRLLYLLLAGGVTLFVTIGYWLPMLEQMLSNRFYYELQQPFAEGAGLPWRMMVKGLFMGFIPPGSSFAIGIGGLLTLAVCLRFFVREKSDKLKYVDRGVIIGIVFWLLSFPFFPWWMWPFVKLSFVQAVCRFFIFVSFFFSLAGGYYLWCLLGTFRAKIIVVLVLIVATLFVMLNESRGYRENFRTITPTSIAALAKHNYHMGGLEYIPLKVPSKDFIESRGRDVAVLEGKADISGYNSSNNTVSINVNTDGFSKLEFPRFYYKGYVATLNGKNIPLTESLNGLVEADINDSGHIEVYYKGTFIQKLSFYLSILGIILFCGYIVVSNNKTKKNRRNAAI